MHRPSRMNLQTPNKRASPVRELLPSLALSEWGWVVRTTCVSLGSQRPGGGSQKYLRHSALGTRQEEEEATGGGGGQESS